MGVKVKAKWDGYSDWQKAERIWQEKVIYLTLAEVEKIALQVERDAKLLVPVDTGDLRKSLQSDISKRRTSIDTEVGTDVVYSEVVEYGGLNQKAQPYLIPSFDKNTRSLENTIKSILRG